MFVHIFKTPQRAEVCFFMRFSIRARSYCGTEECDLELSIFFFKYTFTNPCKKNVRQMTFSNENCCCLVAHNLLRFRLLCLEPITSRLFLLVGVANRGVLQGPVCGLDEQKVQNSIEQPCLEHVPTFFSPSTWQGNEQFGQGNKCSQGASVRLAC